MLKGAGGELGGEQTEGQAQEKPSTQHAGGLQSQRSGGSEAENGKT